MKLVLTAAACALLVSAALAPAKAQISPLGPGNFNLSEADLDLLRAALSRIDGQHDAKVGATENWKNPVTGNSGAVTLVSTFEEAGKPCHRLVHTIKVRGRRDPNQFLVNRCKAEDGSWRTVN